MMGRGGWSKYGGGREGTPFQSNFGTTKNTQQNFHLLTQCFKNIQQVYSRTGTRYLFFYISRFAISVIIGMNEYIFLKVYLYLEFQIGQKPYWISLFFFALNYKQL